MASTNSVDELSNEISINDEADSDEILAGSDVQEVLEEETIDKTSEEFVPDNEANDHDTSVGLDVQENLKEIGNSDEHPSGHSLSANNATEND